MSTKNILFIIKNQLKLGSTKLNFMLPCTSFKSGMITNTKFKTFDVILHKIQIFILLV